MPGTQTVAHVKELYEKLEKFKLSAPEKLVIANIRPEAYAHLTPLLVDVYSRFDEDQLYVSTTQLQCVARLFTRNT